MMAALPWPYVVAVLGGALIGLLLAVFGGGGSVLATPLLVYGVGLRDPHVAIGTSAAGVALSATASLLCHGVAGRVRWPFAMMFGVPGLAGALIGAQLAKQTNGAHLLIGFAGVMALVGLSMVAPRRTEGDPAVQLDAGKAAKLAILGLAAGLASGFFGIGGGCLIVPALMLATGMPLPQAAASSLLAVALFAAATSLSYAASGLVSAPALLALAAGGAVGSLAGAPVAKQLAGHTGAMRSAFALIVLVTAGYVAWRAQQGDA